MVSAVGYVVNFVLIKGIEPLCIQYQYGRSKVGDYGRRTEVEG